MVLLAEPAVTLRVWQFDWTGAAAGLPANLLVHQRYTFLERHFEQHLAQGKQETLTADELAKDY